MTHALQGTDDEAVPISYAEKSVDRINTFGQAFNLTANLTVISGGSHLLLTAEVLSSMEEYVSTRSKGRTRFLVRLVQDLTKSFQSLNDGMGDRHVSRSTPLFFDGSL